MKLLHNTESGGDAMSGVSVGDDIEGVELLHAGREVCTVPQLGSNHVPLDGEGVASKIGRAVQQHPWLKFILPIHLNF